MEDDEHDHQISKKLDIIIALLVIIAMSSALIGRAAVIEHGFWKLIWG